MGETDQSAAEHHSERGKCQQAGEGEQNHMLRGVANLPDVRQRDECHECCWNAAIGKPADNHPINGVAPAVDDRAGGLGDRRLEQVSTDGGLRADAEQ